MSHNVSIFILYHPKNEIRGKLRRYYTEVKANVFVGSVSASVRNLLWESVSDTGTSAIMIHTCDNEQGYEIKKTDDDHNFGIYENYGLELISHTRKNCIYSSLLYAKSDSAILLEDHMMDVGYIAEALMEYGSAVPVINQFSEYYGVPKKSLKNFISFLCAAHDVGKIHPSFVLKMYRNSHNPSILSSYEILQKYEGNNVDEKSFRHERYSRQVVCRYLIQAGFPDTALRFADIIPYHHQGKECSDYNSWIPEPQNEWLTAQDKILKNIEDLWSIDREMFVLFVSRDTNRLNSLYYCILSIMVISDWIASGDKWYSLCKNTPLMTRTERAEYFLEINNMRHVPMSERFNNIEWSDLFDFLPNQLQIAGIKAAKREPGVMIIEYPCGGGKTELAITAAKIMGYEKSGIYIATPTMATAKGMAMRIREVVSHAQLGIKIPELDSSSIWSDDEMDRIDSALWTSKSRHHLLYPFSVGTIDQILKAVCLSRYSCIGMTGLADKVIVVDEIHAYDMFMLKEIEILIKWCRALRIPLILLSATLPKKMKKRLLCVSGYTGDLMDHDIYPLITSCYYDEKTRLDTVSVSCVGKDIPISTIKTSDYKKEILERIDSLEEGCLLVVVPTVDEAWDMYEKTQLVKKDTEIILFHGADSIEHKREKTEMILKKFGKNRKDRPNKAVVIATSIIEQSIDVDFDYLITTLAPIDLLIQRFGRVWRHDNEGTVREYKNIGNPITILVPDRYESLSLIYNQHVLDRTYDALFKTSNINTVSDIRWLIDTVYDNVTDAEMNTIGAEIRAGQNTISSPFSDTGLIENDSLHYSRFYPVDATTRESSYPTVQVALLTQDQINDNSYEMARKIFKNYVVSMAEYKMDRFDCEYLTCDNLPDVRVYRVSKECSCVSDGVHTLEFTKDGMRWR